MPAGKPTYMSFRLVRNNFPRFRARWDAATAVSLNAAGRIGRDEAKKVLKQKQKSRGSQRTQKSISYKVLNAGVGPKAIQITTGTLAGVFVEVGASRSHSEMAGYHYLQAGGRKARIALPGLVRARMHRAKL
jgi:hypothetical protein